MDPITPDQVKAAVQAAGITKVAFGECSICRYPIAYVIDGDSVMFDGNCECDEQSKMPPHLMQRTWGDLAQLINRQKVPAHRDRYLKACGLPVPK